MFDRQATTSARWAWGRSAEQEQLQEAKHKASAIMHSMAPERRAFTGPELMGQGCAVCHGLNHCALSC